jgi:predicted transcriptional regulator
MAANMWAIGKEIKHGGKVDLYMLTVTYTRVIGFLTRHMGKESTSTQMEHAMLETGRKTDSTATELKHGLT